MKRTVTLFFFALLILGSFVVLAQDKANVQMASPAPVQAGGPIAFNVKLNEPLPKGAYFLMRVSPVSIDQQIPFNSGEPTDASRTTFRVSGALPETVTPGKWRVTVNYLFLAGTTWTSNTIRPNDFTFELQGKPFPIPTTAEISVVK